MKTLHTRNMLKHVLRVDILDFERANSVNNNVFYLW